MRALTRCVRGCLDSVVARMCAVKGQGMRARMCVCAFVADSDDARGCAQRGGGDCGLARDEGVDNVDGTPPARVWRCVSIVYTDGSCACVMIV
jgi:hypothetical protein